MSKRAAIYARVSTDCQTTENQLQELQRVAERMRWQVAGVFVDEGISGSKGREKRPEFDRLCKAAIRREFDVVMSWSVDRLGRSLQHLIEFMNDLHAKQVDLYLHQQGIDTTTASGKAMFQMCGVFAEFERAMIQDRVKAGLARAKAQGKVLGRPRIDAGTSNAVIAARARGGSIKGIAQDLNLGIGTVQKIVKEYEKGADNNSTPFS